jgi:hypothetical protein
MTAVHEFDVTVVSLKASGLNTGHVRVECREIIEDIRVLESGIVVGWWAQADVAPAYGTRLHMRIETTE